MANKSIGLFAIFLCSIISSKNLFLFIFLFNLATQNKKQIILILLNNMKRIILILSIALAAVISCNAQKIEMKKVFGGGYQYKQNDKRVTMNNLVKAMENNPTAYTLMKKAQSNTMLAAVTGGLGGALIGFPIGTAIAGGKANWTLAGIGAGLAAISIPISAKANKNARKAVELYNNSLDATAYKPSKTEFSIVANNNGIGLAITF